MRVRCGRLAVLFLGMATVAGPELFAQPPAGPKPTWVYAHDVRVRTGGKVDFDKDTPKIGIEVFKDESANALVAITQQGTLDVIPAGTIAAEKKATWLFAHDLRARKGEEETFTKNTTKYGVEAFKDTASNHILYVSEKAGIAFADSPASVEKEKEPAWHHALMLKVRAVTEADFTKDTKKYGVEVFKDGNTGGLIYISEVGQIATSPAPAQPPAPDKVKPPSALYGLTLRVRKADENDFGKDTKKVSVEVFKDENTGGMIYLSETGSIAAAPLPAAVKKGQGVTWKHAMTLKARPGGVLEFEKANKFGVEVFLDNNSGHLIYISDTGAIAVLPAKG